MPKPIPQPDALSKPFWDAVNERRLIIQNCTACKRLQYPPEQRCANCGSADNLEWREVRGRGKIDGYAVVHDSRFRQLQADQPYNLAIINLEEDPDIKFYSHLPGTPVDGVPVGANVEVVFEVVAPGQLIHEWRVVR